MVWHHDTKSLNYHLQWYIINSCYCINNMIQWWTDIYCNKYLRRSKICMTFMLPLLALLSNNKTWQLRKSTQHNYIKSDNRCSFLIFKEKLSGQGFPLFFFQIVLYFWIFIWKFHFWMSIEKQSFNWIISPCQNYGKSIRD